MNDPDLLIAQRLLEWFRKRQDPEGLELSTIYKNGPRQFRSRAYALKYVGYLVEHECVEEVVTFQGKNRIVRYRFLGEG